MPSFESGNEILLGRKRLIFPGAITRNRDWKRGVETYDLTALFPAADIFVMSGTIINPNTPTATLRLTLSNGSQVNIDVSNLEDTMTNAQILATFSAGAPVTLNSTASTISFLGTDGQTHTLQVTAAGIQSQFQNDLGYNAITQKIEQGFPLTKNTDTLLSTFTRSWTGSTGGKFNIGNDGTVTANGTVADTIVIQPATGTQSIGLNIRATNGSSTVAGNLGMVGGNNGYAQGSVLGDMVLRNLDATKKLIFGLNQTTPLMQLTPTGLKLMYTSASANAGADIDIDGETANRTINVGRRTTAASIGRNLTITAGRPTLGGTDLNGGQVTIRGGQSTGLGNSVVAIQVPIISTAGTADNNIYSNITQFFTQNGGGGRWDRIVNSSIIEAFNNPTNSNGSYSYFTGIQPLASSNISHRIFSNNITLNPSSGATLSNLAGFYNDFDLSGANLSSVGVLQGIISSVTIRSGASASISGTFLSNFQATLGSVGNSTSLMTFSGDIISYNGINSNSTNNQISCVNYYGFRQIDPVTIAVTGEIAGLYISSFGRGTTNRAGVKIDAPTTGATGVSAGLWLTDNTGVTRGGIAFGSTGDTNVYRSAVDTLRTDDTISVNAFKGDVVSMSAVNEVVSQNIGVHFGVDANANAVSIDLGSPVANKGRRLYFYKWRGSNLVTWTTSIGVILSPYSGAGSTLSYVQKNSSPRYAISFWSDGSNWIADDDNIETTRLVTVPPKTRTIVGAAYTANARTTIEAAQVLIGSYTFTNTKSVPVHVMVTSLADAARTPSVTGSYTFKPRYTISVGGTNFLDYFSNTGGFAIGGQIENYRYALTVPKLSVAAGATIQIDFSASLAHVDASVAGTILGQVGFTGIELLVVNQ